MTITDQARQLVKIKEAIRAELKERDTGRWQWYVIDCCMTGKNADLDPTGQQGIELVSINPTTVYFNVHCGITYAGDDVSLNLPDGVDTATWDKALDAYLEQAQHVVCSGPGMGKWDGDSWYFHDEIRCQAALVFIDGVFNVDATVQSMFECYEETVKGWDLEAAGTSQALDVLAGWTNPDGTKCEPGKPTAAAWMPNHEESDDEHS